MMGAKTFSPKPRDIERRWYVVDADGAVLGRLASEVAKILRGKHKPIFAPHADTGDHVIVINAGGVRLTGGKEEKKVYYRHSGYPGGLRELGYARMMRQRPVQVVEKAIKGMLPKTRLGRQIGRKLAVYEGAQHPHQAQRPVSLGLGEVPKWEGLPTPKPAPAPRAASARPRPSKAKRGTSGPSRGGAETRSRGGSPAGRTRAAAPEAKPTRARGESAAAKPSRTRGPKAASSGKGEMRSATRSGARASTSASSKRGAEEAKTKRSGKAEGAAEGATTASKRPRRSRAKTKEKES